MRSVTFCIHFLIGRRVQRRLQQSGNDGGVPELGNTVCQAERRPRVTNQEGTNSSRPLQAGLQAQEHLNQPQLHKVMLSSKSYL